MSECSKCGTPVRVTDGCDWDDEYDMCWDCLAEVHDKQVERIAELERLLAQAESEARAVAESTGCMIVCREGGGPENIWGTLALSVSRLKGQRDTVKADLGEYQKMLSESQAREERLRGLLRKSPVCGYETGHPMLVMWTDDLIDATLKEEPGNG